MSVKVSVVIPTKDRAGLLRRALRSVLAQDYANLEVIVSDDGSQDDTPDIVRSFQITDERIQYTRNNICGGPCEARNGGASLSTGDFLLFVDDDDEVGPDIVSVLLNHARHDRPFITSAHAVIKKDGNRILRVPPASISVNDAYNRQPIGNKSLITKKTFDSIGGFDPGMKASEDYDLYTRLLQLNPGSRGKGVWKVLHTKDGSHHSTRITDHRRELGKRQFFCKHRRCMSRMQRLYYIRFIMDCRAGFNWLTSVILLPRRVWLKGGSRFRRAFVSTIALNWPRKMGGLQERRQPD